MLNRPKYLIVFIVLVILAFFAWYLKNIVLYVSLALIISMIGQPLVRLYSGLRFRRFSVPNSISAFLALGTICLIVAVLISLFIPLIVEEARIISRIDPAEVVTIFQEPLKNLEYDLAKYQINYGHGESIQNYIATQLASIINFEMISGYAQGMIGFTADFIGAAFAILFIAFFFMKDEQMLARFVLLLTPPRHTERIKEIMRDTKRLLTRYFTGILLDMVFVATLTSIGLTVIGVPNAMLIGMFAGLLNVIPYVGPLIGLAFGLLIGTTSNLDIEFYSELLPLLGKIGLTFLAVQIMDTVFFQPLVISNIVKAHPLEIFLVILVAGTLTGIVGMIVAVPVYTILRIIAKEFLSHFQLVRKLTEDLEE